MRKEYEHTLKELRTDLDDLRGNAATRQNFHDLEDMQAELEKQTKWDERLKDPQVREQLRLTHLEFLRDPSSAEAITSVVEARLRQTGTPTVTVEQVDGKVAGVETQISNLQDDMNSMRIQLVPISPLLHRVQTFLNQMGISPTSAAAQAKTADLNGVTPSKV